MKYTEEDLDKLQNLVSEQANNQKAMMETLCKVISALIQEVRILNKQVLSLADKVHTLSAQPKQ